jgi:hypothetical protein
MLSAPVAVNTQAMRSPERSRRCEDTRNRMRRVPQPGWRPPGPRGCNGRYARGRGHAVLNLAEIMFAGSRVVGIHGEAVGYFRDRLRSEDHTGRHLAINPVAAYSVKTLFHELAHRVR